MEKTSCFTRSYSLINKTKHAKTEFSNLFNVSKTKNEPFRMDLINNYKNNEVNFSQNDKIKKKNSTNSINICDSESHNISRNLKKDKHNDLLCSSGSENDASDEEKISPRKNYDYDYNKRVLRKLTNDMKKESFNEYSDLKYLDNNKNNYKVISKKMSNYSFNRIDSPTYLKDIKNRNISPSTHSIINDQNINNVNTVKDNNCTASPINTTNNTITNDKNITTNSFNNSNINKATKIKSFNNRYTSIRPMQYHHISLINKIYFTNKNKSTVNKSDGDYENSVSSNYNNDDTENNIYYNIYMSKLAEQEKEEKCKQETLVKAFKFYLKQKYGNFDLKKMINAISEADRQKKLLEERKQNYINFLIKTSSNINEVFNLFSAQSFNMYNNITGASSNDSFKENIKKEISNNTFKAFKSNSNCNENTTNTSNSANCLSPTLYNSKNLSNNNYINSKSNINSSSTKISNLFELSLKTHAFAVPHIKKAYKGGEDAYQYDDSILIIADGVGGWNSKGVDPALFSKTLVKEVYKELTEGKENKHIVTETNIQKSIRTRIQRAIDRTNKLDGSSTLSFIIFDTNEKKAYGTYIGDSLYLIARFNQETKKYEIRFVSREQSHGFNLPYQVGKQCDDADSAKFKEHEIANKDIFILATDGLWDNLHLDIIINTINQIKNKSKYYEVDMKLLSEILVKKAQVISFNK